MSVEDFVRRKLHDETDDDILATQAEDIIARLEAAVLKKNIKKRSNAGTELETNLIDYVHKVKRAFEATQDGEEPPTKKVKTEGSLQDDINVYATYHSMKGTELADILKWNRQVKTGKKDELLAKVMDGALRGRLGFCPVCTQGRLKISPDFGVVCNGWFNEDLQYRVDCSFSCSVTQAPRLQPWYPQCPTEEEDKLIDVQIEQATGAGTAKVEEGDPVVAKLRKTAAALAFFDISTKEGLKQGCLDIIAIIQDDVDIPEENTVMEVGKKVALVRDKTAPEVVEHLVEEFGLRGVKAKNQKTKEQSIKEHVRCPGNAALVLALHELGELYFKEQNRNAGATYVKATKAIQELSFEVTPENALGLGKNKTKIAGIGKGTAEKMHEFITTGTIAKLEEKRANNA